MADDMLDGFDHTVYKEEVERRWGATAADDSWWTAKSSDEKRDFASVSKALIDEWADAASRGLDPTGDECQAIARRQVAWLRTIPGTPGYHTGPAKDYVIGLGELYVADERFAAAYRGAAPLVRDALRAYAEREL